MQPKLSGLQARDPELQSRGIQVRSTPIDEQHTRSAVSRRMDEAESGFAGIETATTHPKGR